MSVEPGKIAQLVHDFGLEVMMAGYQAEPTVRERVFKIRPISPSGSEWGWRETVVVGDNIPTQIRTGEDAPKRVMQQGYVTYGAQKKWAQSMDIPEEIYKAANAEQVIRKMVVDKVGPWAQGFQVAKERQAAAIFNRGPIAAGDADVFDGSYLGPDGAVDPYPKFCYDGKPFFAASGNGHPLFLQSSVTKFNHVASNPLSATTLESVRVAMMSTNAVDENNNPISVVPRTLLVPPGLTQTAEVLVGSVQQPGTAQNDINTNRGRFDVVQWRYLTDADGWFMGVAGQGVEFADSGDPTLEVSTPDRNNGNVTMRMISYSGAWATNWRMWYGNNIATS